MFPSPIGDYSFSTYDRVFYWCCVRSFRPLSGIILSLLELSLKTGYDASDPFPSPIGDYSFSTAGEKVEYFIPADGSRPLSGITLSLQEYFDEWGPAPWVSVPFRGLLFLYHKTAVLYFRYIPSFRPLSGITLSLQEKAELSAQIEESFRPLSGITLSLQKFFRFGCGAPVVSVPYRGLFFLYVHGEVYQLTGHKCFRPLSGIILSLQSRYDYRTFIKCFRPLSGIILSLR